MAAHQIAEALQAPALQAARVRAARPILANINTSGRTCANSKATAPSPTWLFLHAFLASLMTERILSSRSPVGSPSAGTRAQGTLDSVVGKCHHRTLQS